MAVEVFISYSREDQETVAPIVDLLMVMKEGLVFQDYRSIRPGKKWRETLFAALRQARTVIVFWCEHSAGSGYVKEEYEMAIQEDKDVLPLLLDGTELIAPLAAYQWIDFRKTRIHQPLTLPPKLPDRYRPRYYPKDEHGEYVDRELEEEMKQLSRMQRQRDQARQEVAAQICSALSQRHGLP